jgi:hypothetical protein
MMKVTVSRLCQVCHLDILIFDTLIMGLIFDRLASEMSPWPCLLHLSLDLGAAYGLMVGSQGSLVGLAPCR